MFKFFKMDYKSPQLKPDFAYFKTIELLCFSRYVSWEPNYKLNC